MGRKIILNEVSQIEKDYGIWYRWNLKNNTNESIHKTEADSKDRTQIYGHQRGESRVGETNQEDGN